jgi:LmbE family N-acetylglucosaminyl deacetylase
VGGLAQERRTARFVSARRRGASAREPLRFDALPRGSTVLCLGAHSDDIEIGCGGTILALLAARGDVTCHWVVFSGGGGPREDEARRGADLFLGRARRQQVTVHGFRDGFFPYDGGAIKEAFEALAREVSPDIVFTHARADRHQDHRVVSDLTWNSFRSHLILEYEVPKYDGDLGVPNFFVPLSAAVARAKIRHLHTAFATQRSKHWFTADTFHALLRLRGVESGASEGLAEAFYARKVSASF